MGLADYISRKPHGAAKPISKHDEDFVIAQIDASVKTINAIKQRGRPQKSPKLESYDNSTTSNTKLEIKQPRGRRKKINLQSREYSTFKAPKAKSHKTITKVVQKQHNYNLRGEQNTPNIDNRATKKT